MSYDIYDAAAPVFLRTMRNLDAILAKAQGSGVAEAELMGASLAADMFPLPKQIQSVSDTAKFSMARLAGVEAPPMADTETTLGELRTRLAATIAFVEGVDRAKVTGAEDREIVIKLPNREMRMSGRDYVTNFGLPNFYFHAATAYAILRHKGVALGKQDWLGGGG